METAYFVNNDSVKLWVFNIKEFKVFEEKFKGEILYSTPRFAITGAEPESFSSLYKNIKQYNIPHLNLEPFDYQKFGINFMIDRLYNKGFVLNSDDVGLGKTAQSLFVAKYLQENEKAEKILVVCKKDLKTQWKEEGIEKFTDLSSIVLKSLTKEKRKEIYKEYLKTNTNILIINYELILFDFEELKKMKFDTIIIDEVHKIAQRTGEKKKLFKKLIKESVRFPIFLTGTPVQSKPEDLFAIFDLANMKILGKWKEFNKKYIREEYRRTKNRNYKVKVGIKNIDELQRIIKPFLIRRTVLEVDKEMPEILPPKIMKSHLDATQIEISNTIDEISKKLIKEIDSLEKRYEDKKNNDVLAELEQKKGMAKGLGAAKQALANDPNLFKMSTSKFMKFIIGKNIPDDYFCSPKTTLTCNQIDDIVSDGKKVIVFSKYKTSVMFLQKILKDKKYNIPSVVYHGELDDEERDTVIKKFRFSNDVNVLIGTDAMAEGLNIPEGNYIIHYDLPFHNSTMIQRNGRARRANSTKKHIFVHYMISKNSIDEQMLLKIRKQNNLASNLIDANKNERKILKEVSNS